jgi:hypothetical protein
MSNEYNCVDQDADYLRRNVNNPTPGIFRISACAPLADRQATTANGIVHAIGWVIGGFAAS